jgi:hypothetical protein
MSPEQSNNQTGGSMNKPCSRIFVILLLLTLDARVIGAEDGGTDFQIRIPFHIQYPSIKTTTMGSFGLGAWTILPDVTATNNQAALFAVIGPLWQYDKKGSWVEIMGGSRRNEHGYKDQVIDLRLLDRTLTKINVITELAYFPRKERKRFYIYVAVDTPISLGKYKMRLGIESENVFSLSGKKDSLGIGPRLVLPIPLGNVSSSISSSFTATYERRNDRDFVRCYLGTTWTP